MDQLKNIETLRLYTGFYKTRLNARFKARKPYKPDNPKIILSFIPGTILDILVKPGEQVKKGDTLMILEAMKMQNNLKSKDDGKVKRIAVKKGDKVSKGSILLELD
ncbi:MAG: acetyl-CoA carboxylase biotin carboxyl carrier protein subunit [Bacteroidota bacterium]